MSEFVLWYKDNQDIHKGFINYQNRVIKYAQILQAEPQLWMFIACNEKGEPMEELGKPDYFLEYRGKGKPIASHNKRVEYQKAKARCWFEGWKYKRHEKSRHSLQEWIIKEDFIVFGNTNDKEWNHGGISNIEELIRQIGFELTMTETLIKKLGIS